MLVFQVAQKPQKSPKLLSPAEGEPLTAEQVGQNMRNLDLVSLGKNNTERVRYYVEHGGIRTEPKQVSKKMFSNVLYISKDASFKVGEETVVDKNGRRVVRDKLEKVNAGLYVFSYDTEGGLTLRSLDDPKRAVKISIGASGEGLKSAPEEMSLSRPEVVEFLRKAICDTQALFINKYNAEMAVFTEDATTRLYRGGSGKSLAEEQDKAALKMIKAAVRKTMAGMEEKDVKDLSNVLAAMTVTAIGISLGTYKSNIDQARRELLLANDRAERAVVSFSVLDGKLGMNFFMGTNFSGGSDPTFNPIMLYRVTSTGAAETSFPTVRSYSRQYLGPYSGFDVDNRGMMGEQNMEDNFYRLYNATRSWWQKNSEVKIFGVDLDVGPEFLNSYKDETRVMKSVPKKI
jgi:hypothetical protein